MLNSTQQQLNQSKQFAPNPLGNLGNTLKGSNLGGLSQTTNSFMNNQAEQQQDKQYKSISYHKQKQSYDQANSNPVAN